MVGVVNWKTDVIPSYTFSKKIDPDILAFFKDFFKSNEDDSKDVVYTLVPFIVLSSKQYCVNINLNKWPILFKFICL